MGIHDQDRTTTSNDVISLVEGEGSAADWDLGDDSDFRFLVNSLTDLAIIRLDPQGIVKTWNAGAERLKGYKRGEIIGQHFSLFHTPEDRSKGIPSALLDEARAGEQAKRTGWLVRRDGRQFWGDTSITALRDEQRNLVGFAKVVRDLTERHEAEEKLQQSEERLHLLIASVVDYAIIGLDPQGVVETWNAGATRVKGYSEDEIVGQHFSVFYSAEDRAAGKPLKMLDEARKNGRAEHTGWRVRKDGSLFWGDVVVTALRDTSGLVGFVKITRDRTDEHIAEVNAIELDARAVLDLAKLHELRSNFVQSIAHDLRSPLAAISGFAQLLREGVTTDPEQRQQYVHQIENGVGRLSVMVEGMLEMAKLESGAVELHLQDIVLRDAVDAVVAMLQPTIDERSVNVGVNPSLTVRADAASLERIFVNLISNAVRFSPVHGTVSIDAITTDALAVVSVMDEGKGVAEEDKEIIFERFRHGSDPLQRHASYGLGLSMVRDYVELHGGRIWVAESPAGGAKFVFSLPTAASSGNS